MCTCVCVCVGLIEHVLALSGCVFFSLTVIKRHGGIHLFWSLLFTSYSGERGDGRETPWGSGRERGDALCCLNTQGLVWKMKTGFFILFCASDDGLWWLLAQDLLIWDWLESLIKCVFTCITDLIHFYSSPPTHLSESMTSFWQTVEHTVTHRWSEIKIIVIIIMSMAHSEPLETAHRDYCHIPLPHYFNTLASFKTSIQLSNISYSLKETEKHNMSPLMLTLAW